MAVDPRARAISAVLAVVGTLFVREPLPLLLALLLVILPLLALGGGIRGYSKLAGAIGLPVIVGLFVVWGLFVGAPPGMPLHSDPTGGILFAATVGLRLLVLAAILYLAVAMVAPPLLPQVLRGWGLRGDLLAVVLGTFVLVPELAGRAGQVMTARYARGLIGRAAWTDRLRSFPQLLRPLLAWSLRSAAQRSELWDHRKLVGRLEKWSERGESSRLASATMLVLAGVWLGVSLFRYFHG